MTIYLKTGKKFTLICFFILCIVKNGYSQTDIIESKTINWGKIYSLVVMERLPELDAEKEREILEETDKILHETKSLYKACNFLMNEVAEKDRKRYLIVGNKKIKEKLVELFKMRIQCELKEAIQSDLQDSILSRKDISEEDKMRVLESINKEKELMNSTLNYLIMRDGDMCLDCYIRDTELKKLLTPPPGQEEEFEPEGVYYNIEAFYSVALSTFVPEMYDYLWLSKYDVEELPYYPLYFYILKVYPKEFLNDISHGFIRYKDGYIYRKEGEGFRWEDVFNIAGLLTEYNSSFVEQEKDRIKTILGKYFEDFIGNIRKEREELFLQISSNNKKEDRTTCNSMLTDTFFKELRLREKMLAIYERIGEKEDVEDIKKLAEDIPLDYPVWESNREGDEKQKERYLQRVKELQDRVKVLVEKLSQQ
ncbi:MAG: hypothetical protein ACP5QY_03600 [Candidatus Hydrogenedens sp.]